MNRRISSWANTNVSHSDVFVPENINEVCEIIKKALKSGKKVLGRGAGRSYGDQALNDGHIVVDMSAMKEILKWDAESGLLSVESGANYDQVIAHCLPYGWIPAVIPGTRYVTMGGALANNVHGKNSYVQGNFGQWVREFKIVLSSGEQCVCSHKVNSDLFFAVIGGSGLLGIVTEMTLQLVRIPSFYLSTKVKTAPSLYELMDKLDDMSKENDFAIAQVDCFSEGSHVGRGTISAGSFVSNHKETKDLEKIRTISPRTFGLFPKKWIPTVGKYFLNNYTMHWISWLKYYMDRVSSKENSVVDIFQFTFILDGISGWSHIYRHGVFEYQVLVPKEKARDVIPELILLAQKYDMPGYISAIKVHKKDDFLLSFSMDGYSFAMDIPRQPEQKEKQDELFREMNKITMKAGGIVYLAKDTNLTAMEFQYMYKNLEKFVSIKKKYDPHNLFESDMYRRLFRGINSSI